MLQSIVEVAEVAPDLGRDDLRIDPVVTGQVAERADRLPLRLQRPDPLLLTEVRRHADGEEEGIAARVEVRGLTLIGDLLPKVFPLEIVQSTLLDEREVVLGADGNIELLFPVRVEVAEEERERAVVVRPPALIRRRYDLPALVLDRSGYVLRGHAICQQRARRERRQPE
jgi:hypothetical protein